MNTFTPDMTIELPSGRIGTLYLCERLKPLPHLVAAQERPHRPSNIDRVVELEEEILELYHENMYLKRAYREERKRKSNP